MRVNVKPRIAAPEELGTRLVAAQLGVRYILKGSVRKAANRVRVTSQLIDVTNSSHLWAEKYDRELTDIFALQDDITNRVIGSVGPQVLVTEAARVQRKAPQSVDAWDLVMRAVPHMWRMNTQEHAQAQELLQQAIALDANYAHAHALLGWTYVTMFNLDTSRPIGEFTDKALAAGARAVALDDEEPWAHLVVGLGHARRRRPGYQASLDIVGTEPQLCAGPRGARICVGMRGSTRARAAGSRAGKQTEPARSVSGNLRTGRAVYGAVRARTV